jgi:hypothetical protein
MTTYPPDMPFRFCRRLVAVTTAALFLLSAVTQHLAAAGMVMDARMEMQAKAADMPSQDDATHCPASSDCSDMHMACFTHCATVLGILSEPVPVPISMIAHKLNLPAVHHLASLHGPPEPHPPKPLILI